MRGESEAEKKKRLKEEEIEKKQSQKWKWYSFLYRLSDGDILKFGEVTKLNFLFSLSFLSFELENKNIVKNTKIKPVINVQ